MERDRSGKNKGMQGYKQQSQKEQEVEQRTLSKKQLKKGPEN